MAWPLMEPRLSNTGAALDVKKRAARRVKNKMMEELNDCILFKCIDVYECVCVYVWYDETTSVNFYGKRGKDIKKEKKRWWWIEEKKKGEWQCQLYIFI